MWKYNAVALSGKKLKTIASSDSIVPQFVHTDTAKKYVDGDDDLIMLL